MLSLSLFRKSFIFFKKSLKRYCFCNNNKKKPLFPHCLPGAPAKNQSPELCWLTTPLFHSLCKVYAPGHSSTKTTHRAEQKEGGGQLQEKEDNPSIHFHPRAVYHTQTSLYRRHPLHNPKLPKYGNHHVHLSVDHHKIHLTSTQQNVVPPSLPSATIASNSSVIAQLTESINRASPDLHTPKPRPTNNPRERLQPIAGA